ncbi:MAG: ribosome-associated translation inhibitor RaiA [Candidatus Rokuibacteriota bacterium]|nr:MAG: ribosome-associated translation inhibitor RaiA [Candidatus Rokubacteria bacterium]
MPKLSLSSPRIATGCCSADTIPPRRWPASWAGTGSCRSSCCSPARMPFPGRRGYRSQIGAATFGPPSDPPDRCRRPSAWSTTSTRAALLSIRRRERCGKVAPAGSRSVPSLALSDRLTSADQGGPMQLLVKGRNVEVTAAIEDYAQRKLGKLAKQLAEPTRVELELAVERNPSISANHVAEATIWTKGPILRAREASEDMKASIDLLADKLERQVKRYRQKRRHEHERHSSVASVPAAIEENPVIVRKKQFTLNPLTAEEAVLQLELVGHDFYVFRNLDSGEINVVYRRDDGGYGLIEPA